MEHPNLSFSNLPLPSGPSTKIGKASLSKYFGSFWYNSLADSDEISDGFKTAVFPAAIAPTSGSRVKLNG